MDAITPVGAQIIPPNPNQTLQTLSGIFGVKQQQQALQLNQQALQRSQIETQQAQGVNQFFSTWNPGDHHGDDGTLDIDSAHQSPAYQALPGVARIAVDSKLNDLRGQQLQNKQALSTLNGQVVDQAGKVFQAAASVTDPQTRQMLLDGFANQGPDQKRIMGIYQPMLSKVPPAKVPEALKAAGAQAQDVSAQQIQTNPVPTTFDTGGKILPATINRATGIPTLTGQQIEKVTPPTITTNAAGQTVRVAPGGTGISVIPNQAPPGTAGTSPNANPNQAQALGQREQAEAVSKRVSQVQEQAASTVQAQDALSRARAIIESGESPNTGAGFEQKRQLKNVMSNIGIDTTGADDMNTLSKNLARYEASRATAVGLGGTDAARELAHNGSPNTQLDNKALQGIVRQSLATEKVLAGYANVQSKTNDPQQQLQNEAGLRAIPHPIETMEYTMSRNKNEAEQYLKEHGLTHADVSKSALLMKQFGIM
jgi:hypothetical protein